MRKRLKQFELELHGEKTRLLEFGRHAALGRRRRRLGKLETFTFLGFTFICGKSRPGALLPHRKTHCDRMTAKLREIKEELRRRMHAPIPKQGRWGQAGANGFLAYHAVPTNFRALNAFRYHITSLWLRSQQRRSRGQLDVAADAETCVLLRYPRHGSFIHGQASALPSNTQGKSRVRELRKFGYVREALCHLRPYFDSPHIPAIAFTSGRLVSHRKTWWSAFF